MSNWCNNYATITSRTPLEWLDSHSLTDVVELPGSEYYAFGLSVDHAILGTGSHEYMVQFETKWAPPIDFYDHLSKDSSILIDANYSECGSEILWTYDINGHHEGVWPDTFYSDILGMEIHLITPPHMYIDIERDEYLLFDDYLKELYEVSLSDMSTTKEECEAEIQECAVALQVNLEDQQWTELISSFSINETD